MALVDVHPLRLLVQHLCVYLLRKRLRHGRLSDHKHNLRVVWESLVVAPNRAPDPFLTASGGHVLLQHDLRHDHDRDPVRRRRCRQSEQQILSLIRSRHDDDTCMLAQDPLRCLALLAPETCLQAIHALQWAHACMCVGGMTAAATRALGSPLRLVATQKTSFGGSWSLSW